MLSFFKKLIKVSHTCFDTTLLHTLLRYRGTRLTQNLHFINHKRSMQTALKWSLNETKAHLYGRLNQNPKNSKHV